MPVESSELCWFNGEIIPLRDARVSVEDRGFQFADGVYEAVGIYNGKPFALERHLDRLEKSCAGLKLALPISRDALRNEILQVIKLSPVPNGLLYLQLTRGVSKRSHVIPQSAPPTLLFYIRPISKPVNIDDQPGAKLISTPDLRWRMCSIKTISLAASVLARFEAANANAEEAVFVDEHGIAAECTSCNLFIVLNGKLITHPVGPRVLRGITRDYTIDCAKSLDIECIERPIQIDEAKRADEVFITSTTRQIVWVNRWDDSSFPSHCGKITQQLARSLDDLIQRSL